MSSRFAPEGFLRVADLYHLPSILGPFISDFMFSAHPPLRTRPLPWGLYVLAKRCCLFFISVPRVSTRASPSRPIGVHHDGSVVSLTLPPLRPFRTSSTWKTWCVSPPPPGVLDRFPFFFNCPAFFFLWPGGLFAPKESSLLSALASFSCYYGSSIVCFSPPHQAALRIRVM